MTPTSINKLARALRVTPATLMGPPSVPVEPGPPPVGRPPAEGKPRGRPRLGLKGAPGKALAA